LDLQVRADAWPTQSETVLARDFLRASGGKGANVAFLAARLGVAARLFGRVGDDAFAELALAPLRAVGVDLVQVKRRPNAATGTSMIVVRDDGDKTIVLAANANLGWEEEATEGAARWVAEAPAGSVLVADLEVPTDVVREALRAARARGLTTVLDPSPGDRMERDLYACVDFLTPNPREAQRLSGIEVRTRADAERAGRELHQLGAGCVCMKLGDGGAVLVDARGTRSFDAPKVEVVDKSGAGDAFAGALGAALTQGRAVDAALRQAVLAATFAVTRYGSQASYPDAESLARFATAHA
jgi:ribokinase